MCNLKNAHNITVWNVELGKKEYWERIQIDEHNNFYKLKTYLDDLVRKATPAKTRNLKEKAKFTRCVIK